jgi:hypothetical protein
MKKPLYVVMSLAIVVLLVFTGALLISSRNFDNDRLATEYAGTITFPGRHYYAMQATFDGHGRVNGTLREGTEAFEFEGDYLLLDTQFSMQAMFGDNAVLILQGGFYSPSLSGDAQLNDRVEVLTGTFLLTLPAE